jgi:phage baseplate assembly protein V
MSDFGNSIISRGEIVSVADDQGLQRATVDGFAGERIGGQQQQPQRIQSFGLSSVPPVGSVGLIFSPHGNRDQSFLLGYEHPQHRPRNMQPGSVALYDASGGVISIVQKNIRMVAGSISIECTSFNVQSSGAATIKASNILMDGQTALGGEGGQPVEVGGGSSTAGKVTAV